LGERSGAPSGLRPSSFVMWNTPVEVQFTSAECLNYPCRTPVCSALAEKGFLVRAEAFTRPTPQRQDHFSDEAIRVLTYLFKMTDPEHRDVGVMAKVINLERNALLYHLDRLEEAKLAENTGFNYVSGRVYWDLTAQGRRYVVEHKLV
jgi:DNA-binding MarR family transcriptional regulator